MIQDEKETAYGPAVVSLANAARAFDAPVRYPILFNSPGLGTNFLAMPRTSAFLTLIEHLIGVFILGPILLGLRGFKRFKKVIKYFTTLDWVSVVFISFGGSALGLFFFLIAFGLGNPTVAILLQKVQPIMTLVFAILILKERPTKEFYISLAFSLIGVILISFPDIKASNQPINVLALVAVICSLLAATFWGGSTVFGRVLTKKVDYWDLTLIRYIGGSVFLIVFNGALLTYNQTYLSFLGQVVTVFPTIGWNWTVYVGLIYAAIFTGGILPLTLYYFGLKRSKASVAGLAELAFPLLAIFINYYFLGFGLTLIQIIGAVILLATVSALSFINAREMEKTKQLLQKESAIYLNSNHDATHDIINIINRMEVGEETTPVKIAKEKEHDTLIINDILTSLAILFPKFVRYNPGTRILVKTTPKKIEENVLETHNKQEKEAE